MQAGETPLLAAVKAKSAAMLELFADYIDIADACKVSRRTFVWSGRIAFAETLRRVHHRTSPLPHVPRRQDCRRCTLPSCAGGPPVWTCCSSSGPTPW